MDNFSPSNYLSDDQLSITHQLIDEVSKKQLGDFGKISSDLKSDGTLITECDRWSDKKIVEGIKNLTKGEGVLSEEGSQIIPESPAFWVVDPLDGTTNFAAGIPYWAISIARFTNGKPQTAFLDIPSLKKRFVAIRGKGVWLNNSRITSHSRFNSTSECVSLCSRSIKILQLSPQKPFPGKIRLLGVSSLNMTSVAIGQTIAALEATPKIWDLAAAWLILSELGCEINWLEKEPCNFKAGEDLSTVNFPVLTASSKNELEKLLPWSSLLINKHK